MMIKLVKSNQSANMVKWMLISDEPITEDQAKAQQERGGYPVAGYGFMGLTSGEHMGAYRAVWYCSSVCE